MNVNKKRILTGDRPTGRLHIGHYVGSLINRIKLQDEYDCFFIIADYQVLTDHLNDTDKIENNIIDIMLDYLSVGLDPNKCTFFIQSMVPEIAELTMILSMLVQVSSLQRNPTIKEEMVASSITQSELSYGFLGYPVSQAADILSVKANIVPVGDDQLPHLEQTRNIARKFNSVFSQTFPIPKPLLSNFSRLPGIDGDKMSKSRKNAIYLTDNADEVRAKITKAYTDPTRIKITDPGHLEGNVVFTYLDAFCEDKKILANIKEKYVNGKIGDVKVKEMLTSIIIEFLRPIQKNRNKFVKDKTFIKRILAKGIARTRAEASQTMSDVKKAINFSYPKILFKD